jgi:hypothetical protein
VRIRKPEASDVMDIDESLLDVVPVRPEHASQLDGCTHTCKHIPVTLDDGKPIAIYPVRFVNLSKEKAMNAALCRECYVRLPRENQLSTN